MVVDGLIGDVVAALVYQGVNLTVPPEATFVTFRGRFVDVEVDVILSSMASAMSPESEVFQRQGFCYVGPPQETDLVTGLFYVPNGEAADWQQMFHLVANRDATVECLRDVVAVRDTEAGVKRLGEFHHALSASRRQFVVDVTFLELDEHEAAELGIDFDLSGVATLGVSLGSGVPPSAANLTTILKGIIKGSGERGKAKQVLTTRLLVAEGESASIQSGSTVNVPKKTVSDQGTVSDTGVLSFDTGILLTVTCRSLSTGRVRLDLAPEVSEVTEIVNGLPTVNKRKFTSVCFVGAGSTVVLGGLSNAKSSQQSALLPATFLPSSSKESRERTRLYFVLHLSDFGGSDDEPDTKNGAAGNVQSGVLRPVGGQRESGARGGI